MPSRPLKELYAPSPPCLFSAALQPCLFEEREGGGESLREDGFWRIQLPSFPHPSSSLSRASSGEEQSGVHADVE